MAQTYLVTGATGTLGTALVTKLLAEGHRVRGLARNEHGHERLLSSIPVSAHRRYSAFVGDVRDTARLRMAMIGATHVIHAAAMKIIPRCEYDPEEAIKTNIQGTDNVMCAALWAKTVERAVLVSTDKASAPTTHYGATKLCAERLWLAAKAYAAGGPPEFVACRYGNVWGSQGSVIHVFREQHKHGKLRITDPRMTRFHMTLGESVDFVLRTLAEAKSGELWIPKLPTYSVMDLANAIDRTECHDVTGIRPGEKLAESLISRYESHTATEYGDHYRLTPGVAVSNAVWEYTSQSSRNPNTGQVPWRLSEKELVKLVEGTPDEA